MKKLALCITVLLLAQPVYADELKSIRTISVSGMAERDIVPDEAHLSVNLNSMELNLAAAKSAHDAKLSKLLAITKAAGIDEKNVKTNASNIEPVYSYDNVAPSGQNIRSFKGYRVQTNLDITVSDTKKTGALMEKISQAGFEKGANTDWGNLLNLSYTISNPDEIRDVLLVEAIKNAKDKAQRMASATNAKIARVYQINENSSPQFQPVFALTTQAKSASFSDAALPVSPPAGEQKLQTTVSVIYELE